MTEKLKSRKLGAAVVGVLATAFQDKLGLDAASVTGIQNVVMAYLAAQGVVDLGTAVRKPHAD